VRLDTGRDRDLSHTPLRKLGHDSQERRGGGPWREFMLDGSKLRDHLVVHGDLNACSRVSLDPPNQGRQLFSRFADREFHRILQVNQLKMYNHVQRMSMHKSQRRAANKYNPNVPFAPLDREVGVGAGDSEELQGEDQMNQERNFSQWFKEVTGKRAVSFSDSVRLWDDITTVG